MHLNVPQQTPFPALGSPQAVGGRGKVALKPGRSLMDWIRVGKNSQDLAGTGGRLLEVTEEELAKHDKVTDAWLALRGRVYNVTPYMEFHPGGEDELMRGAGKDGTSLFDEVHKWVNFESMLEKCLVGRLKVQLKTSPTKGPRKSANTNSKINGFPVPAPPGPPPAKPAPRYEWHQTDSQVTVSVYTKWRDMKQENVIIDRDGKQLTLTLLVEDYTFTVHLELENDITQQYEVRALRPSGKVEVVLRKDTPGVQWASIGRPLQQDKTYIPTKETEVQYRTCTLLSVSEVNHDTRLYGVGLPAGCRMCIPIGFHVHIKGKVDGMELVRSYTVVLPSLSSEEQEEPSKNGHAFYLMIKIYPNGALTPLLGQLQIGDTLEVSSPTGDFVESRLDKSTHLVMFAAGTGFTPMVRLIYKTTLRNPDKDRSIHLSFFNKTQPDIVWREQLETLGEECPNFQLRHILSQPDDAWEGLRGRVRKELMEGSIPQVKEGRRLLFCACGPTPFTNEAIRLAKELGYTDDMVHAFLA